MTKLLLDPPVDDLTRREFIGGGLAALLLAGCSRTTEESGDQAAPLAGFPVTIDHLFGSTVIPAEPKRVVVAGLVEQDPLLALGIVPVATTEWFGEHPGAIHPWAREELGDGPIPEVLNAKDRIPFERIAALRPDLILAIVSHRIDNGVYDTLSGIAPTVVRPAGDGFDTPWQEVQLTIGRAVGRSELAERLVAETEARLAQVKADNPIFATSSALFINPFDDGSIYAYTVKDSGVFLTDLGFKSPPEVIALSGGSAGGAEISPERLDLLDVDLLYVSATEQSTVDALVANPLYSRLDVHTQGRDVFAVKQTDPASAATSSFIGVLSYRHVFDKIVPRLIAALDGDPTTEVPQ
ncbi:MAG: ABC transporter substrate-binding protein [Actinomycetota bacterium]